MTAIESILNADIFDLLQGHDTNNSENCPVIFWFYSDEEGNIYRLAHELMQKKYQVMVSHCTYDNTWLCIAETMLTPRERSSEGIINKMNQLAVTFNVMFDGMEIWGKVE